RNVAAIVHLWSDNRSTSEAASELHSSRLGALHPRPIKINDLNVLAGFGSRPFRLAKLTACRKCGVCIDAGGGCQGGKVRNHWRFRLAEAVDPRQFSDFTPVC